MKWGLWVASALALGLLGGSGCKTDDGGGSGGGAGGGDSGGLRLLRVEIDEGGFDELKLKVIVAVTNAGGGDVAIDGGTVEIALLGPAGADDDDGAENGEAEEAAEEGAADDGEGGDDSAGDAPAATVTTGVYFEGEGKPATVPPDSRAEYPLRVTWPMPDDPAELGALLDLKTVKLSIRGTVTRGGSTDTFAGERELTLPEYPSVVLNTAQVASEDGGSKGAAFFVLGIDNPNSFTVNVDAFGWGISVGGKELQAAGEGSPEIVPAATMAEFEDNVNLNAETFGPEVAALLSQPAVPYVIEGFIEVAGVRRPVRFEGEMAFAR